MAHTGLEISDRQFPDVTRPMLLGHVMPTRGRPFQRNFAIALTTFEQQSLYLSALFGRSPVCS
jgi:hypothetical protein